MNVFLIGWSPAGDTDPQRAEAGIARADLLGQKLGDQPVSSWSSPDGRLVVATMRHSEHEMPGVRYVHTEDRRIALFAGRPFVWVSDLAGDGMAPLDARFFVDCNLGAEELDGPFAAARYDGDTGVFELVTDRMGAYPVYTAEDRGVTWFGNVPFCVGIAAERTGIDAEALGRFLTFGWAVGGRSLWDGVTQMPRGTVHARFSDGRPPVCTELLSTDSVREAFGGSPDLSEAAPILTATLRALGSWPGRPNVVPVSGGRDSRVVVAAATAAGLEFAARTIAFPGVAGYPNTPDVMIAGEVMKVLGHSRQVVAPPHASGVRRSAVLMRQATNGLVSLGETGLIDGHGADAALELIHSGHGGETSRGKYYIGESPDRREVVKMIFGRWSHRYPPPITRTQVLDTVHGHVGHWVDTHLEAGFAPGDMGEVFHLFELLPCWLAPAQRLQELSNDTTAPLWSPRMLPYAIAGTARDRLSEPLHFALLDALHAELTHVEFADVNPAWPTFPSAPRQARRYRTLLFKVHREARRRLSARRASGRGQLDELLLEARAEAAVALSSYGSHVVWDVLDRRRTSRLLSRDPHTLDPRSQRMIWRLASVMAPELYDYGK